MEYKEVHRKNGKTTIFCNFEDLLQEAYGVKSMREVETFAKGEEYICHCPFCKKEGHTKHKLYIKTDLTVGHCFVCCRDYINVTDKVNVNYNIPKFTNFLGDGHEKFKVVKLAESSEDPDEWTLDRFRYEFDDFDKKGYDYLVSRHGFMKDLYKILGFKFIDGNIAMPFFYHGELVYYQIRFSGKSKIRYFFPPIEKKLPWILDHKVDKPRIIICEGIYDAIACLIMAPEFIPVAVLGSSISDYQLEFIREYVPEQITIFMDETKISQRIAEKVRSVIDYCPIRIIKSEGQDPEEKMKELLKWGKRLQVIKPVKINKDSVEVNTKKIGFAHFKNFGI